MVHYFLVDRVRDSNLLTVNSGTEQIDRPKRYGEHLTVQWMFFITTNKRLYKVNFNSFVASS